MCSVTGGSRFFPHTNRHHRLSRKSSVLGTPLSHHNSCGADADTGIALSSFVFQVIGKAGLTNGKPETCSLWVRPARRVGKQDCATSWMPSRCCRVRRGTGWANNFNVFAPENITRPLGRSHIAIIHAYHLPTPLPVRDQFGGTIKQSAMARRLPLKAEDHLAWHSSVWEYQHECHRPEKWARL